MKTLRNFLIYSVTVMGVLFVLIGCSKKTDDNNNPTTQIPVLSTSTVNNITQSTAIGVEILLLRAVIWLLQGEYAGNVAKNFN